MPKHLLKLLLLPILFFPMFIGITNSVFSDEETFEENRVSTGCWEKPSKPKLTSPEDGKEYAIESEAAIHVDTIWEESKTSCPDSISKGIDYAFELYRNDETTPFYTHTLSGHSLGVDLDSLGDYFWRVRACDSVGCSGWADKWKVVVNEPEEKRKESDGDSEGGSSPAALLSAPEAPESTPSEDPTPPADTETEQSPEEITVEESAEQPVEEPQNESPSDQSEEEPLISAPETP